LITDELGGELVAAVEGGELALVEEF